jgi:hypothetical protein
LIIWYFLGVCLNLAQLNRPHDRQYIALHNKGKRYFALHSKKTVLAGFQEFALDLL